SDAQHRMVFSARREGCCKSWSRLEKDGKDQGYQETKNGIISDSHSVAAPFCREKTAAEGEKENAQWHFPHFWDIVAYTHRQKHFF
ncbi:MAG TPA: hypothetical protein PK442_06415, partial [Synergistales bacterium]|nr:hypothetical protein [Synergistales bacterium]